MQWPRKLYDHEEIPPPHCWEEIREKLAAEPVRLGHALYDMEASPPADAWEQIRQEIRPAPADVQIAPAHRIARRPILSYAAILVGFGILAAVLVYILKQQDAGLNVKDLAAGLSYSDSQRNTSQGKQAVSENAGTENQVSSLKKSDSPVPDTYSQRSIAEKTIPKTVSAPAAKKNVTSASKKTAGTAGSGEGNVNGEAISEVNYSDGNYIQLVEADGDVTRVSYKLEDMIRTVHQSKRTMSRQEQERWKKTLETWKSKMAQSTYIPSGSNFFDIAEMVEFLNTGR